MVIISLELTRVNSDQNIFSINVELTSTFLLGPSPSPNFNFFLQIVQLCIYISLIPSDQIQLLYLFKSYKYHISLTPSYNYYISLNLTIIYISLILPYNYYISLNLTTTYISLILSYNYIISLNLTTTYIPEYHEFL